MSEMRVSADHLTRVPLPQSKMFARDLVLFLLDFLERLLQDLRRSLTQAPSSAPTTLSNDMVETELAVKDGELFWRHNDNVYKVTGTLT